MATGGGHSLVSASAFADPCYRGDVTETPRKPRVLVAMSGGVDSSVAALLLVREGYEVVGVTLHLWDYPEDGGTKGRCCAPEDVHDARRVADALGFPHYAFDRRELFEQEVVTPFVEAYLRGETPSPCVRCNRGVKVRELVALADRLGAARIATGHYARTIEHPDRVELVMGRDANKDQSYFLHMLGDEVLRRFLFPLGDLDKKTVRALASEANLPGANKGESQELCFVPTGRYDELVEKRAGDGRLRPGPILGPDGRVVGQHGGIHKFTRGQRRNLSVAVGERAYVVGVDVESGTVRLGAKEELLVSSLALSEISLRAGVPAEFACEMVVRYRGKRVPARVTTTEGGRATAVLAEPVVAPSAGQYAVFYDGEVVLGGALIEGDGLGVGATAVSFDGASP